MTPRSKKKPPAREIDLESALAWLEKNGSKKTIAGMARYGIPSDHAFGVTVGATKAYGKSIGENHDLAQALWKSGWYEARLLAAFIDDPDQVTAKQMDGWATDFDNWAICDTVCFALFDRAPLRWSKVHAWASARAEFKKRAAFALLWALTVHDKGASNEKFLECLPLIEAGAVDERDYVKKGVDMALRAVGKRNPALRAAARDLARHLARSERGAQSYIGRSALRELDRVSK